MSVGKIAEVTFTSADRVRDVIHNFNDDGFESLYPKYKAAGRERSPCLSGMRSRRSPSPSRPNTGCRSRPGAWRIWPTSWSLRGWSTTSATRACGSCSARRACHFNG
nr:hypothetical protein [Micromonospora sp. 4G51]